MKFPITYNTKSMTLRINMGKYSKYLQCPFATWWKARKYFKRPKFKFYFGPMWKYRGKKLTEFGEYDDYEYKGGYWPAASTEFLKWYTPKWFPIHVASSDIMWKDKWNTPRYEMPGYFIIFFGRDYYKHWQFSMVVTASKFYCCNDCTRSDHDDNYWESMLWYLHYGDEYNSENDGKRDLIKARETMRTIHWSTSDNIIVDDYKIMSVGEEILNMGCKEEEKFVFINVRSDKLLDYIDSKNTHPYNKLHDNVEVLLDMDNKDNKDEFGKCILERSAYYKIYERPADPENEEIVRLYYREQRILEHFRKGDYGEFELKIINNIDLGPAFKDDFLTDKAIKEIQQYYKKKDEKSE